MVLDDAAAEGRTSNYGCMVWQPKGAPDPWHYISGMEGKWANGECSCDNFLINTIADTVLEAMPIIAQITCYVVMSSLKLVLDIGLSFAPGVGKALSGGLDMLATAAQMASDIYPEDQDPGAAFSWWLSPCGGTDLVPEDIQRVFEILGSLPSGVSSFKAPKNIPKGSGRKGDEGNPTDRSAPRNPGTGTGNPPKKKCRVAKGQVAKRLGGGHNMLRNMVCDANDVKKTYERVVTSVIYAANAQPTQIQSRCLDKWTQACYHYSSAFRVNPAWATLTCVPEGGVTKKVRAGSGGKATAAWSNNHKSAGWTDQKYRAHNLCQMDEYPLAYLLNGQSPAWVNGGNANGQEVRYLPDRENQGAGSLWKGVCFEPVVKALDDKSFTDAVAAAIAGGHALIMTPSVDHAITYAAITVDHRPEFTITAWDHAANPLPNDGLDANPWWPSLIAPQDPGFALNTFDPWYNNQKPPYKYADAYNPPQNGV